MGAYSLLRHEAGLHRLDHRYRSHAARTGREKEREDTEVIRVDVFPAVAEPDHAFVARVKAKVHALKPAKSRLVKKADMGVSLFHEASLRSLEVWTTGPKDSALARGQRILCAEIQGSSGDHPPPGAAMVRQYGLGIAARVKDLRTGRSSSRIDKVLKGHLDLFVAADTP